MTANIFDDLFVLELANNHWGSIERGIRIITEFGEVARQNNVKAAISFNSETSTHLSTQIIAFARIIDTSRR